MICCVVTTVLALLLVLVLLVVAAGVVVVRLGVIVTNKSGNCNVDGFIGSVYVCVYVYMGR